MTEDTRNLYNAAANRWIRNEPQSLSDFTGRPPVFELCGNVAGKTILDVGCGEGYCSRILSRQGPERIEAIDLSERMIELANSAIPPGANINYQVGSATSLPYENDTFDLAIGVFVYNYITVDEMRQSMAEVHRTLAPGGRFVFSVPHPALPFIRRACQPPFYFDLGDAGYFSSRNEKHSGEIYRRDGTALPVQVSHKVLADYFDGLRDAGFHDMPIVRELGVTAEHLEIDREFFQPVYDVPLHIVFCVHKNQPREVER